MRSPIWLGARIEGEAAYGSVTRQFDGRGGTGVLWITAAVGVLRAVTVRGRPRKSGATVSLDLYSAVYAQYSKLTALLLHAPFQLPKF